MDLYFITWSYEKHSEVVCICHNRENAEKEKQRLNENYNVGVFDFYVGGDKELKRITKIGRAHV